MKYFTYFVASGVVLGRFAKFRSRRFAHLHIIQQGWQLFPSSFRLFKVDHGLFLNLTLFLLLKIRCSIRVWEKCTSSLNKLAWAVVGLGFWRPTNRQCRVVLVGKWPLNWPRGTGSGTFRWQIILESKIWANYFFGGAFPLLKVEQRPWFSAQTFLNYRSFTSRKQIAER